jgi:hypothetical protein
MAIGTSLSSPTASEQAFHHHHNHHHNHHHQSNPNNHHTMFKQLSKSVSIDEQSSNGIMMIAPLTTSHNGDEEPSSSSLSSTYGGVGVRSSSSELEPIVPFSKQPSSSSSSNDTKSSPQIIDASAIHLLDFSMFDLIDKTSRKFVLKPATVGLQIKCQIYRQKVIQTNKLTHTKPSKLFIIFCVFISVNRVFFIPSTNSIWKIWTPIYCCL